MESLVGQQTELVGDLRFTGVLHVDGTIKGNVAAEDGTGSVLSVSENGTIEGDVRVPHVVLDGVVVGDVYAGDHVEIASRARVTGNVYYNLIEMAVGAEVNGNLVHRGGQSEPPLRLSHDGGAKDQSHEGSLKSHEGGLKVAE
ncbi:MAG: cell shape determination protein CcmA [Gammaproteobacteria bacterium]|nr:cell shape determination protein CcmA [Gammaproteobacteria bacterium]NIR83267.1 cell shape determination protein CcmA [Gammaproteobacteria bacterium]NIR91067.1 cell shape determination protein CcmA [Gammaproteobacteria bacterium]NIU04434.1 cell shape determination protein CcmA [Gammaproteobacteria bacterium]NIW87070.1 cell shape determination protein CcmA [Gammaproteobacteria bacterium]